MIHPRYMTYVWDTVSFGIQTLIHITNDCFRIVSGYVWLDTNYTADYHRVFYFYILNLLCLFIIMIFFSFQKMCYEK